MPKRPAQSSSGRCRPRLRSVRVRIGIRSVARASAAMEEETMNPKNIYITDFWTGEPDIERDALAGAAVVFVLEARAEELQRLCGVLVVVISFQFVPSHSQV